MTWPVFRVHVARNHQQDFYIFYNCRRNKSQVIRDIVKKLSDCSYVLEFLRIQMYSSNITVSTNSCCLCPSDSCSNEHNRLNEFSSLPSLSISYPDNACHLTNLDSDLNMPTDYNFSYYTPHGFQ